MFRCQNWPVGCSVRTGWLKTSKCLLRDTSEMWFEFLIHFYQTEVLNWIILFCLFLTVCPCTSSLLPSLCMPGLELRTFRFSAQSPTIRLPPPWKIICTCLIEDNFGRRIWSLVKDSSIQSRKVFEGQTQWGLFKYWNWEIILRTLGSLVPSVFNALVSCGDSDASLICLDCLCFRATLRLWSAEEKHLFSSFGCTRTPSLICDSAFCCISDSLQTELHQHLHENIEIDVSNVGC